MKSYIFFFPNGDYWLEIANKIKQKGIAKPILVLGCDSHYQKAKELFGDESVEFFFLMTNYPYLKKDIDYRGEYAEFWTSKNYIRAKDRCMKMLDRIDNYGTFSRKDREVYFHYGLIWALKFISKSNPDALLTVVAPHTWIHYLIYEICRFLEIPILRFCDWTIAPCLFLKRMDTDKIIKNTKPSKENQLALNKIIESHCRKIISSSTQKIKYTPYYINHQKKNTSLKNKFKNNSQKLFKEFLKDLKYYFIIGRKFISNTKINFKNNPYSYIRNNNFHKSTNINLYDPINPFRFNFLTRFFIQMIRKNSLNLRIINLPSELDLANQFVYFPLHFEHEKTTNPDGGIFHDQLIALVNLRKIIPLHIPIIVKEHPTQFNLPERGPLGRSPMYYEMLKNLNNVKVVGIKSDSLDLINNSILVSTITGTVAYEAALLGKKSIIFGDAWFEGTPNIFKWQKDMNFDQIISKPLANSSTVIDYLKKRSTEICVPGTHNSNRQKRERDNILSFKSFKKDSINSIISLIENGFLEI